MQIGCFIGEMVLTCVFGLRTIFGLQNDVEKEAKKGNVREAGRGEIGKLRNVVG